YLKQGLTRGITRKGGGVLILGLGIDIIEIHRVEKSMVNPVFMDKIYTKEEQRCLRARKNNPSTAAGYFAAKEAAAKALGTGFGKVKWTEIEVICHENGKPSIILSGNAKIAMDNIGGSSILVSISHSRDNAIAQVLIC